MKRVTFCITASIFCFAGCSDDTTAADSGVASADGGTAEDGNDGSDEGEPFEPVPARGLTITGVSANHGINVHIADGVDWVGPSGGREGRLVAGRDTMIRVYHELDPDWVEHEVEARLELVLPGGEVQNYEHRKVVVTDTNDGYLDGGFWFAIPADLGGTEAGTRFQVSLWDVGPGGEALDEHATVSPASGPAEIGFESIPMEMNVFYVPFTLNGTTPDLDDASKLTTISDEIYQMEPIQRLNSAVDTVHTSGAQNNVCGMLGTMQQIWSADGAPSNVYYVGLVDTGANSGVMGCALLNVNFNADVWVDGNISTTATSVVHELGHNQGLNHVECDDMGNPSEGNDPSYPDHPEGRTLNTGFGIRNFDMFPGESTIDYMSYCSDRWVSPWTWARVWSRIQSFTEQGSPFVVEPEPVMEYAMYADGSTAWWTALARFDPEREADPDVVIEFLRNGEVFAREAALVDTLSDGKSVWVTVRMPNGDPEAAFDSVRYVSDDKIAEARRSEVSFYTQLDLERD